MRLGYSGNTFICIFRIPALNRIDSYLCGFKFILHVDLGILYSPYYPFSGA